MNTMFSPIIKLFPLELGPDLLQLILYPEKTLGTLSVNK